MLELEAAIVEQEEELIDVTKQFYGARRSAACATHAVHTGLKREVKSGKQTERWQNKTEATKEKLGKERFLAKRKS